MQHIKSYMAKIDAMIENPQKKKKQDGSPDDKSIRIIATIVKNIRETRKELLDAKQ